MYWDKYRREDGSIDLAKIFIEEYGQENCYDNIGRRRGYSFLKNIEAYQLIKSRQAAAIALASAWKIVNSINRGSCNEI